MPANNDKIDIKKQIAKKRLERIAIEGFCFGHPVPKKRLVPIIEFGRSPFVICEVKRKSPSKGNINLSLDAVKQAQLYVQSGIKTISVLTEEDYFSGSLQDLMDIKKTFPDVAVLRKDFLLHKEDLEVSYRAGADAVLLIASLLEAEQLKELKEYGESLGLSIFVEVHDKQDILKSAPLKPSYTGINCRNLADFSTDRIIPVKTQQDIAWNTKLVFESGIFTSQEAQWAAKIGFQGVLVGEGAVKNSDLPQQLVKEFKPIHTVHTPALQSFWSRLYGLKRSNRPLVKICGLTRQEDVEKAADLGADLLGFIFAPSPRQVNANFLRSLKKTNALKIGVVVLKEDESLPEELHDLLNEGYLDGIQFHGKETHVLLDQWSHLGYKALGILPNQFPQYKTAAPRILLDGAKVLSSGHTISGGTGLTISDSTLASLRDNGFYIPNQLWLAGGLTPENIASVIQKWKPELIDASSGLESAPGIKDERKMKEYFNAIANQESFYGNI